MALHEDGFKLTKYYVVSWTPNPNQNPINDKVRSYKLPVYIARNV